MTRTWLDLTRPQILAFRRHVGALDERLPPGRRSLRRAAWAGLQDSMPRAALLSIHARVEGTGPATWEDRSLVQLWGPRFNVFVVAACDLAVFSLGTLPDGGKGRQRAADLAARLNATLGGARMTYGAAAHTLGVHHNSLKYAAATGTVLIRWEGARQPAVWTVPPPEADPRDVRLELARRYLHIYGPATPEGFGRWAGIGPRPGSAAFEALGGSLTPVQTPVGEAWILSQDEAIFRAAPRLVPPVRLLPSGDAYLLLQGADRDLLVPDADRRRALWTPRVWPGGLPGRGRDRRDVAARGHGADGAALAAAVARRTRCGHGGGGVIAAPRNRGTGRRRLGRLSGAQLRRTCSPIPGSRPPSPPDGGACPGAYGQSSGQIRPKTLPVSLGSAGTGG